jgi:1-acyl-sn-glycerol-3-phosphate acyltransferase
LTPELKNLAIVLTSLAAGMAGFVLLAHALRGADDTLGIACFRLFCRVYLKVVHRLRIDSPTKDPLPSTGPAIVVANHRSSVDPFVIGAATGRRVRFLMAREYYEVRGLRWLFKRLGCIPVNRDGSDLGATKTALKALKEGEVIAVFPQGGIREAGGALEGKDGTALFALRTGAPVVPMYVDGTPNLDSVFLALLRPSRSSLRCGSPLPFRKSDAGKPSRESLEQATARILGAIESLRAQELAAPGLDSRDGTAAPTSLGN